MITAEERRDRAKMQALAIAENQLKAIDKAIEDAAMKGKMKVDIYNDLTKMAEEQLRAAGYKITNYSSQKEGTDIEISWDGDAE